MGSEPFSGLSVLDCCIHASSTPVDRLSGMASGGWVGRSSTVDDWASRKAARADATDACSVGASSDAEWTRAAGSDAALKLVSMDELPIANMLGLPIGSSSALGSMSIAASSVVLGPSATASCTRKAPKWHWIAAATSPSMAVKASVSDSVTRLLSNSYMSSSIDCMLSSFHAVTILAYSSSASSRRANGPPVPSTRSPSDIAFRTAAATSPSGSWRDGRKFALMSFRLARVAREATRDPCALRASSLYWRWTRDADLRISSTTRSSWEKLLGCMRASALVAATVFATVTLKFLLLIDFLAKTFV